MSITVTWPLTLGQVQCPSIISAKESLFYTNASGDRETGVVLEQRCQLVSGHSGRHARDVSIGIITWPNNG